MSQIYHNGMMYREVNVDSLSEIQIQHAMHNFISESLSDWTCYFCDLHFERNGVGKKCDLVLVHTTKHIWCAIEIERSMHSIFGQHSPQQPALVPPPHSARHLPIRALRPAASDEHTPP